MAFSTLLFLFGFLPVFLLLYALLPARLKNWGALLGSAFFYAWGAPKFIAILIGTSVLDYVVSILIHRCHNRLVLRRTLLLCSLALNLGCLFYVKYLSFFADQMSVVSRVFGGHPFSIARIALPLGISFITFQRISYVVDVYWKRVEPARDLVSFLLYVFLFPKLTQGPIVRFGALSQQIASRKSTLEGIACGGFRFAIGLAKKVLIADVLGEIADPLFHMSPNALSLPSAWLAALCYAYQIYFDFSGYTDMAIGLGSIMGFSLPENFDRPYLSRNISEFWRRWHISLSTWLRDYLFLPISYAVMHRTERDRVVFMRTDTFVYVSATLVTMFVAGLWHGASWTFVAWGLYYGVLMSIERRWLKRAQRLPKFVTIPPTFLAILLGWVIFRSEGLGRAASFFGHMVAVGTIHDSNVWADVMTTRLIATLLAATLICFLPAFELVQRLSRTVWGPSTHIMALALQGTASLVLFTLSASALVNSSYHPFIYWRF